MVKSPAAGFSNKSVDVPSKAVTVPLNWLPVSLKSLVVHTLSKVCTLLLRIPLAALASWTFAKIVLLIIIPLVAPLFVDLKSITYCPDAGMLYIVQSVILILVQSLFSL